MGSVRLFMADGRPYLEATDGKVFGRFELELEEGELFPEDAYGHACQILFDARELGRALAARPSKERTLRLEWSGEPWASGTRREFRVEVDGGKGTQPALVPGRLLGDELWPATDEVLRLARDVKPARTTTLDPALLARVARAAGSLGVVSVQLGDSRGKATRLWGDGFEALVMPISLEVGT